MHYELRPSTEGASGSAVDSAAGSARWDRRRPSRTAGGSDQSGDRSGHRRPRRGRDRLQRRPAVVSLPPGPVAERARDLRGEHPGDRRQPGDLRHGPGGPGARSRDEPADRLAFGAHLRLWDVYRRAIALPADPEIEAVRALAMVTMLVSANNLGKAMADNKDLFARVCLTAWGTLVASLYVGLLIGLAGRCGQLGGRAQPQLQQPAPGRVLLLPHPPMVHPRVDAAGAPPGPGAVGPRRGPGGRGRGADRRPDPPDRDAEHRARPASGEPGLRLEIPPAVVLPGRAGPGDRGGVAGP